MKPYKYTILFIFFLFSSICVFAQANFQQHQQQMSMMNLNIQNNMRQHQQFMQMHMMNSMNSKPKTKIKGKYKFNFVMLNGDTIFNNKKISISFLEPLKEIKLKNKKQETTITPDQTKEIFIHRGKKIIRGIQHEDYWVFNTQTTPEVNFYSPFPEENYYYITLYQTKGDTLNVLTKEKMLEIVKDYPKAVKDVEKRKMTSAINRYIKEERKKEQK